MSEIELRIDKRMELEYRDPTTLTPHPDNYRAHSPEQIAEICKSIRKVGQFKNVVVRPDGTILAGHGVVAAACEMGQPGFADAWYWSLVYGGANFGLQVGGVAPGSCAGPMDVKHSPLVLDPVANIEWHCREMLGFYKRGVRGRDLCESVFLPANPRDWGNGRFRRTDAKFRECIRQGYEVGKLP